MVADACRHHELTRIYLGLDESLRLLHHVHLGDVGLTIEEDVAGEEGVLRLDHLRSTHVGDVRELLQRELLATGCGDGQAVQRLHAVAIFAHVAHAHGVALPPFDRARQTHSAESDLHDLLHLIDAQPVASDGGSIQVDLDVGLAHDSIRDDRLGHDARHLLQELLELEAKVLDRLQIRPLHLDAHGRAHAALEHHDASRDGHQDGRRGEPGRTRDASYLREDVLRAVDLVAPLTHARSVSVDAVLGLVADDGLEHRDGRWIERRVGASELAHDAFDLGDGRDGGVHLAQHVLRLTEGCVGHGGRHEEERPLVEGRHELATEAGEGPRHGLSWRARGEAIGQPTEDAEEALPGH